MTQKVYVAHFDGSAKPNPGDRKIGGRIVDPNGKVIYEYSEHLGHGTNNEAEYLSLVHIAAKIAELGINEVQIFGDSQFVVRQVNGLYKTKEPRMRALKAQVLEQLWKIPHWEPC